MADQWDEAAAQFHGGQNPHPPPSSEIPTSNPDWKLWSTAAAEKQPVTYNSTGNPLGGGVDMAAGALAGLAKTGVGIYDFAKKLTDVKTPYGTAETLPSSAKAHELIDKYAPTTLPGKVGQYGEQAAEFAIPGGAAEEAMKGASLIPRVVAQAGIGAGVSAAQSGGDPASIAIGAVGGALGPVAGKVLPGTKIVSRNVENVNAPVIDKALELVAPDVRMTPGQRAGQAALQTNERNLMNSPGTATRAQQFYQGQQEDIGRKGAFLIAAQGGLQGDDVAAGKAVEDALANRVKDGQAVANDLYDEVRKATAANVKNIQTGSAKSPILDANGKPIVTPIMSAVESPVALGPIRAQLLPIYDDLTRNLPLVKQQSSPAYTALKTLMESPDKQMPAMDFDKFLGGLKSITRSGQSGALSTQSQRLAARVIESGEGQLSAALADAGPDVAAKLQRARDAVKGYHDTNDFLQDIRVRPNEPYEPAAIFHSLMRGKDNAFGALSEVAQRAPETVPVIGQTFLQRLMDTATREGGWGRSAGVDATWNNLGPRTKQLLFGQKGTQDLENFFLAAKKLTPAQGSPTADRLSALTQYGDIGTAIAELVAGVTTGHPLVGAVGAAATLGKTRLQPAILASLSFKPAGAQLLRQALTLPTDSPAFARTMQALTAMAQAGATKRGNNPPSQRPNYAPPGTEGAIVNKYQQGGGILAPPPTPPGIGAPTQ